jgi:hypothetical protein
MDQRDVDTTAAAATARACQQVPLGKLWGLQMEHAD